MGVEPQDLARDVEAATRRLVETVAAFDDADVRAPSRLPDWTRGHVLTHLARNADGLVNLLGWCHGQRVPMYESDEARDHDIEAGAARTADQLLADVRASAERFAEALDAVPEDGWDVVVELRGRRRLPTSDVPWKRLLEVEVHHLDLGAGYDHADWSEPFTDRLLEEVSAGLPDRLGGRSLTVHRTDRPVPPPDAPRPVVSGSAAALTAWLTGRSPGTDLTVDPPDDLPAVPSWI